MRGRANSRARWRWRTSSIKISPSIRCFKSFGGPPYAPQWNCTAMVRKKRSISSKRLPLMKWADLLIRGSRLEEIDRFFRTIAVQFHRSEEHTSELQSRRDLVCRLLLEKKKK